MAFVDPTAVMIDGSSIRRKAKLRPGMCGHNSLFVGQIGDWTWDTVAMLCGTDVFAARNENDDPSYLAFYYFRIRADPTFHVGSLSFGDELAISSKLFNFGSESILTLHQIGPLGLSELEAKPIECEEFYERPGAGRMYVETFNRWIARSEQNSNEKLVRSSPVDFEHSHLPVLPERYSPRRRWSDARTKGTFHDMTSPGYRLAADNFRVVYRVDITRDINAVGLIYFAAYFSIVDSAILRLWRHLGRTNESFLARTVLDHQICFLGNAGIDAEFHIDVKLWENVVDGREEIVNVEIHDGPGGRAVVVATIRLLSTRRGENTSGRGI